MFFNKMSKVFLPFLQNAKSVSTFFNKMLTKFHNFLQKAKCFAFSAKFKKCISFFDTI